MVRFLHELQSMVKTICKLYLFSQPMFWKLRSSLLLLFVGFTGIINAQYDEEGTQGDIRGFVYSAENGDRLGAATIAVFSQIKKESKLTASLIDLFKYLS